MITDINNYNRGTINLNKGKYEKALQFFKRQDGEFKELFLNMANTYRILDNPAKAWENYFKSNSSDVLDLDGNGGEYANALSNMGLLAYQENDDDKAEEYYLRALSLDPLHFMSIWNYSLVLLRRYCSGAPLHKDAWKMHEYRFKAVKAIDNMPRWDGKSHVDSILVLNEQGLGDKLMYGRYLRHLENYGKVVVQCHPVLDSVFPYKCVRTVEESGCTVGIPFGCLPEIFGRVDGVWIDASRVKSKKLTVAVEWGGSSTHLNDRNRSCYNSYFYKLAKKFPSVKFVNVRPGSEKVVGIERLNCATMGESVEALRGVDLVISVDTSLVHLAGSMGIETWMLQPLKDTDFRWGNAITKQANGMHPESNIWYESVSVLENPGWDKVFAEVEKRLEVFSREHFIKGMLGGNTIEEFVEKVKNV